jgi:hypothetical protein
MGVPSDPSNDCQQQERQQDDKVKALGYSQLKFRESAGGETDIEWDEKPYISEYYAPIAFFKPPSEIFSERSSKRHAAAR